MVGLHAVMGDRGIGQVQHLHHAGIGGGVISSPVWRSHRLPVLRRCSDGGRGEECSAAKLERDEGHVNGWPIFTTVHFGALAPAQIVCHAIADRAQPMISRRTQRY